VPARSAWARAGRFEWEMDSEGGADKIGFVQQLLGMTGVQVGHVTKLFAELPEELDETWQHGFVVGGMAHHTSAWELAQAYKLAADVVIDHAREQRRVEAYEIAYPALYLYRQCIELYLKAIVPTKDRPDHDLVKLITRFAGVVSSQLAERVPESFLEHLLEFAARDPNGTAFRFADERASAHVLRQDEGWVELASLREVVDRLAHGFENVLRELNRRAS